VELTLENYEKPSILPRNVVSWIIIMYKIALVDNTEMY